MGTIYRKIDLLKTSDTPSFLERLERDLPQMLDSNLVGAYQVVKSLDEGSLVASSKLFSAKIRVQKEQLELEVSLSLLASAFQKKIEREVDQWLEGVVS